MSLTIYTDGSAGKNPGRGGWGAVYLWEDGRTDEVSGGYEYTTSSRAELHAVINALDLLRFVETVTVVSDSKYLVNAADVWVKAWAQNDWKLKNGKPVKNRDLWEQLLVLLNKHFVKFCWVQGHAKDKVNQRADQLAREASKMANRWPKDLGYEAAK